MHLRAIMVDAVTRDEPPTTSGGQAHYVGDDCPAQIGRPTPVDPLGVPCPTCGVPGGTACTSALTHPVRDYRARIVAAAIDENMTTDRGERITDEDVRVVAEQMLRRYESEYSAGHLTWLDFAVDARADLETAFRPGGLVARAIAAELERIAHDHADGIQLDHFGAALLRGLAASWREGRRQ